VNVVLVFIGGGIGAVCRYWVSGLASSGIGIIFPLGTLIVNLTGAFVIGFLYSSLDRIVFPVEYRLFILTGFLGGFTTFSTYSLESVNLVRDGEILMGALNILLNNGLGLLLAVLGLYVGRLVFH